MEPIEINAGAWYLRARRPQDWEGGVRYAWDVCEPVTGDPVAEVALVPSSREHAVLEARPAEGAAAAPRAIADVLPSVTGAGRGALGFTTIDDAGAGTDR